MQAPDVSRIDSGDRERSGDTSLPERLRERLLRKARVRVRSRADCSTRRRHACEEKTRFPLIDARGPAPSCRVTIAIPGE